MKRYKNFEDIQVDLEEFKTANDMINDELNSLRKFFETDSNSAFNYSFKNALPKIELLNNLINDKLVKILKANNDFPI